MYYVSTEKDGFVSIMTAFETIEKAVQYVKDSERLGFNCTLRDFYKEDM